MSRTFHNLKANNIRQVIMIGDIPAPATIFIEDGIIQSRQDPNQYFVKEQGVIHTWDTYKGSHKGTLDFLGLTPEVSVSYVETEKNLKEVRAAQELLPFVIDAFSFMTPRTATANCVIIDVISNLINYCKNYDLENENSIAEMEGLLQPFWSDSIVYDLDEINSIILSREPEKGWFYYRHVIYQNKEGVWCYHPQSRYDSFGLPPNPLDVPSDYQGELYLISFTDINFNRLVENFKVRRFTI